jgi:hypothetical protein
VTAGRDLATLPSRLADGVGELLLELQHLLRFDLENDPTRGLLERSSRAVTDHARDTELEAAGREPSTGSPRWSYSTRVVSRRGNGVATPTPGSEDSRSVPSRTGRDAEKENSRDLAISAG